MTAGPCTYGIYANPLTGTYSTLLRNTFSAPIKAALDEFCEKWLRCKFESGGKTCCNVQNSHKKGHQESNGKIFAKGEYDAEFNSEDFINGWMTAIDNRLEHLSAKLNQMGVEGQQERDLVPRLHRDEIKDFLPTTAKVPIISHATCFCCVRKVPEHVLPCGHVLCKACVESFGTKDLDGAYELECCPLHPDQTRWLDPARITPKPLGAGVRVLCLDG